MANKKSQVSPRAGRQGGSGVQTGKTGQGNVLSKSARRRQRNRRSRELVYAPTNVSALTQNHPARISGNGGVVVVSHREFITDVSGSVGFAVAGYPINPGQVQTFPWLSNIARNFEKYRFRSCKFVFESSVATFLSGMTMLAVDLDASDPPPANKANMMSYSHATRANVWTEHATTMPEQQPELYVRGFGVPPGTDIKTYDAGTVFFATSGEADDSVVGELYVEYVVELHVPQLNSDLTTVSAVISGTSPFIITGNVPVATPDQYPSLTGRLAIQLSPGERLLVCWFYTGTATPITVVAGAFMGSSGTIVSQRSVLDSAGLRGLLELVVECSSTTNATFEGGPGWFTLSPSSLAEPSVIAITGWQQGLSFPATPAIHGPTMEELVARLTLLENACPDGV